MISFQLTFRTGILCCFLSAPVFSADLEPAIWKVHVERPGFDEGLLGTVMLHGANDSTTVTTTVSSVHIAPSVPGSGTAIEKIRAITAYAKEHAHPLMVTAEPEGYGGET